MREASGGIHHKPVPWNAWESKAKAEGESEMADRTLPRFGNLSQRKKAIFVPDVDDHFL